MGKWLMGLLAVCALSACGGYAGDGGDQQADETLGEVSEAEIIGAYTEGFFRVTDITTTDVPIYALYNDLNDARWTKGGWYCHVSDNGEFHALSVANGWDLSSGKAKLNELVARSSGGGTQGYCPWPSGMIVRTDPDGTKNVYSIQHADYKTMGTVCWVDSNAKVIQAGGWGRVWQDPSLTWSTADLSRTTKPRDNTCAKVSGSTGSCKWHIPACPNTYPW